MPNHFHAILIIGENEFNTINKNVDRDDANSVYNLHSNPDRDAMPRVSLKSESQSQSHMESQSDYAKYSELEIQMINKNKFAPQSKNLASIMRGFKSSVTMFARENKFYFDWQPRFYDHVIRDSEDYQRISKYIINNPAKWNEDNLR